jgi:hypothetical protein
MGHLELLMPRYFFDIKDGHRLVDPSGQDCLDDADALSKGETMARQLEADGPVDMDPQRHVAVINEEGQQIGKIAVRCVSEVSACMPPTTKTV